MSDDTLPDPHRVDPDGIDADMKQCQWMDWEIQGEQGKVPKQPGNPSRYAKSNDATTWGSFNDALDTANGRDLGIGLPLAQASPFLALDIDVPDGGDWVPDLNRLGGAVVERSPSGNLRVYLRDVDVPEWWTNQGEHDGETREVGIYEDSGYVTVTGDVVDGHEPPIADTSQVAFTTWLKEAWRAFNDEDEPEPWETATGDTDQASHSKGSSGQTTAAAGRSTTDLGIYDVISRSEYPPGERRPHPYHDSSTGKNFKVDKDGDAWRCFSADHDTGGYAIHLVGMEAGIIDCGEWSVSELSDSTWREIFDAARERGYIDSDRDATGPGEASADGGTAATGASADGAADDETSDDTDERGDDRPEPDGALRCYDGGYAVYHPPREEGGEGWYEQLTNFEIEATTFLRSPDGDGVRADLDVYPGDEGQPYEVTVPLTAFNEPRRFKRNVVTGRTTTFDGDIEDLNRIRRFVGSQDAPERIGVEQIGLFGDAYAELVTPAGTLGGGGWIDEPEHAYVKQGIGIEAKWSLANDGDDTAEFDREAVAEVLETLPRTREADRLLPVLGWFYASGLRPLVHEWTGEFNLLNVTGGTGAGKSSTLGLLWELFGMDDDPLSVAEETKFAVTRSMAATNSVPVWFDEYKPATTDSWRIDALHGLLRTVTRGGTVQRGNADKTTDEYTLAAPVVVSGEQRIQGAAEQRRCVMTTFSPSATDDGTDTARAYKELTGEGYLEGEEFVGTDAVDPRDHALAYYRFVAGNDPADARERWDTAAVDVASMLAGIGEDVEGIGTAAQQGLQTVVFGLRLYREFADSVCADVADLIDEDTIESAVRYSAREFVGGGHKSHVDTLVELAASAARNGYIEPDEQFAVTKDGTPNAEIRINMTAAFAPITKFIKDYDVSADVLDTYGDYRDRFKEAAEDDGGYVVAYRQNSPPVGRAVGIHAQRATDALDEFEARAFGCETIADRESDNASETEPSQSERVENILQSLRVLAKNTEYQDDGVPRPVLIEAVVGERIPPADAKRTIEELVTKGRLIEGDDDRLFPK